jgi:hypothetical protein
VNGCQEVRLTGTGPVDRRRKGVPMFPRRPGPAAEPPKSPMVDQLSQLAAMHSSGVLTDEEFAVAKARLLA